MPAPGRFVKALTGPLDCHRLVVHLVQNGPREDVHGDTGAAVRVRWRAGSGWEGDFETEDRLVGRVEEFVFVDEFEDGEG